MIVALRDLRRSAWYNAPSVPASVFSLLGVHSGSSGNSRPENPKPPSLNPEAPKPGSGVRESQPPLSKPRVVGHMLQDVEADGQNMPTERPLRVRRASGPRATHRPLSSSFWGLCFRILNIDHKEPLRGAVGTATTTSSANFRSTCPAQAFGTSVVRRVGSVIIGHMGLSLVRRTLKETRIHKFRSMPKRWKHSRRHEAAEHIE